ncbi:arylsulfatase (predicted) [Sugiyamaella lignohabitans]|uniref:Arylsulfatase (Predicted) n=1 Tax=Sugiyamaella lignohabitans TaxID=796027 RepID=A0A167DNV4_9ASCO|nr:arylsulfatase (predicted) [Sugiyamaella lignohabitans]ANB13116.1 arylsulfatase (predicted) [Sugiyamaella lignohabitans]
MTEKRPNFLIIVADDLGWSDVSPFGGEIHTPNLQALAERGIRFTDFHTASACSPTRSMLLSGTDHHIAGLGQMAETISRYPHLWKGKPGYEGYLNDRVAALPEILSDNGYRTLMSGKWHLGLTADRTPAARGFQESFALLPGAGNHYAYEPGTFEKPALPFLPPLYSRNDKFVDYKTLQQTEGGFYSSDYFATQLIDQLATTDKSKPFFAYLPFTAPHWPLQAPKEIVDKYKGVYDEGPDVLREKRLEAQRKLGLIDDTITIAPVVTGEKEWSELTAEEKAKSARTMEIYAAMVELLDKNVGRVVDHLRETGELDNTFVLFMSDNGAEGSILEAIPILSANPPVKYFNNSFENLGNHDSFIWYGPRWAQASTAPSQLSKGYILEGGIRCPLIVSYPGAGKHSNVISREFTTVMDILPTVLELAQIKPVGETFRSKPVLLPRGKSWAKHLESITAKVHQETTFTGWELFGQRAVRRGNYKAVYIPNEEGNNDWELYDLTKDKGETKNIAKDHPDILADLLEFWLQYEAETGVVVAPDDEAYTLRLFFNPSKRAV